MKNSAFQNVLLGLKYAPAVSGAVQDVEAVNASLPGATKKQLVMASVQAAAKVGEGIPEPHVALIAALIDIIVGTLNATGVFAKAAPAAVPAK